MDLAYAKQQKKNEEKTFFSRKTEQTSERLSPLSIQPVDFSVVVMPESSPQLLGTMPMKALAEAV